MAKSRNPNTARKPPVSSDSRAEIEDWFLRVMPDLHPIVKQTSLLNAGLLDELMRLVHPLLRGGDFAG